MKKAILGLSAVVVLVLSNGCALSEAYAKASKGSSMSNSKAKAHNIEVLKKECEGAEKMAQEMGLKGRRLTIEQCIQQGLKDSGFN
jgi:hypothetical protein